jgi:hypothetical protein
MPRDHERYTESTRRQFLKTVAGGGAGALLAARAGYAHHHRAPSPQSLPYLDQRTYLHNMEVVAHVPPGPVPPGRITTPGRTAGQMMAIGPRRFMVSSSDMIEVTDPRNPTVFNQGWGGGDELCYNAQLKKWILMRSIQVPHRFYETPFGKYEDPEAVKAFRNYKGFRGIQLYDVTDPAKIVQLGEYNTGPTGFGTHGDQNYYDGGQYAYLACVPDDTFTGMPSCIWPLASCLVIVDMSDPANVKEVSRWWVPGQRNDEVEALKQWPCMAGRANDLPNRTMTMEESIEAFKNLVVPKFPAPDRLPFSALHGPVHVPIRVEDGGTVGYGSWSCLGFWIHDLSNVTQPKLHATFDPAPTFGADGISFHTIWLGTLSRGFVVCVSESLNPDCNESWLPSWVVDVRDLKHPVPIAQLPRPKAPPDAPFTDFCFRGGRFSSHRPPYLKAPGRISQTFLPLEYFNAGIRCYDLSEPTQPKEVAWFVPPMGGVLGPECVTAAGDLVGEAQQRCMDESNTFVRPCNSVSIEWDRNIIYAGTTTGLYVLTSPALGKPIFDAMPVTEWSLPSVNKGVPA